MGNIIFISHATPTDNEFAAWLATKLQLCGYNVWVDLENLRPSTDFWKAIENTIRNDCIRFIFVATKTSVLGNRDGVLKELAIADRMAKTIPNFIIPVRVDDIDFNDFPVEFIRLNAINFYNDWASGLSSLLRLFEEDAIEKSNSVEEQDYVRRWNSIKSTVENRITNETEYYCSNLFPVELPSFLYAYHLNDIEQYTKENHIPIKKVDGIVYTYYCPLCMEYGLNQEKPLEHQKIKLEMLSMHDEQMQVFGNQVSNTVLWNYAKELMNWNISRFFYQKNLRKYRNNPQLTKRVYYFQYGTKSRRDSKSREILLAGKRKLNRWHYGVSAYYVEFPISGVLFNSHIIFTYTSGEELSDASQIAARRSKGRLLYNKQWKNYLKTAIYYLSGGESYMEINPCCGYNSLRISCKSMDFVSPIGYVEPQLKKVSSDEE